MMNRKPDWLVMPIKTPLTLTLDDPPGSPTAADPVPGHPPTPEPVEPPPKMQRFLDNLELIRTWDKHEILMLVQMTVDLWDVSIDWLQHFREDLDIVNDGSR